MTLFGTLNLQLAGTIYSSHTCGQLVTHCIKFKRQIVTSKMVTHVTSWSWRAELTVIRTVRRLQ